tara:strand:+ start:470 stop:850 length:381 start_codon:yes stop_codon:yes gene_type:complete
MKNLEFIARPANAMSLVKRKLVLGVGINDVDYRIRYVKGRRTVKCPYYLKWHRMLLMCYCPRYAKLHPRLKRCTVVNSWLTFSVFKAWMMQQEWFNRKLSVYNTIYSPLTCEFTGTTSTGEDNENN